MNQISEIVIVTLDMGHGGAERVFSELSSCWVERGIPVTIIQTHPDVRGNNFPLHHSINLIDMNYPQGRFRRTRQTIDLIKLLRERKGAVVIAFMPQNKLLTGMASFFINNKIVFTERNDPAKSPGTKLSRFVRNVLYELADLCVFQTSQAKEYFSKRVQSHGCVIQNPINPDLPEPFVGKRKKVVIAAARLEAQKNLFMLIDAFAMFHEGHPDYHLEIYGKGPLKDALSQRITDRGISEAARLMGYSNDVYSCMCDCAMYVSSSDFEGISNSMLEAMGLGLPTICTDCPVGGARETIEDGVNGVLIPVGDVRALYNAMTRVADDSEFAHRISMKAIDIRQKLSAEVIANQWIKAIESL